MSKRTVHIRIILEKLRRQCVLEQEHSSHTSDPSHDWVAHPIAPPADTLHWLSDEERLARDELVMFLRQRGSALAKQCKVSMDDMLYVVERLGERSAELRYFSWPRVWVIANELERLAAEGTIPSEFTKPRIPLLARLRRKQSGPVTSEEQSLIVKPVAKDHYHTDIKTHVGRFAHDLQGFTLPKISTHFWLRARILDAGCSAGHTTNDISKRYPGCSVIGLEISPEQLAKARQNYPKLTFVQGSYYDLPALFPKQYFDIVFMGNNILITGFPDDAQLIKIRSVIREGGYLIMYADRQEFLQTRVRHGEFTETICLFSIKTHLYQQLPKILNYQPASRQ